MTGLHLLRLLVCALAVLAPLVGAGSAQAACSSYGMPSSGAATSSTKVVINEYNYSGNYIELKLNDTSFPTSNPTAFNNLRLRTYVKSGSGYTLTNYSVSGNYPGSCGEGSPYIRIDTGNLGNDLIVALFEDNTYAKELDYFRLGQASYPTYYATSCFSTAEVTTSLTTSSITYHQAALTGSSARKDIARSPDGIGRWLTTPYTGSDQGTPCSTNDATLNISKTITSASSTVKVGEQVTFQITASLDSRANSQSNVKVTDILPAGAYVSHSTATGTFNSGTGVWTIGTLSAGGSATLTLVAKAMTVGTWVNTASIESSDFPAGDGATSSATVTVQQPITISKSVTPNSVSYNTAAAFKVTVTNTSSAATPSSFTVTDGAVPSGLTSNGTPSTTGGSYADPTWTIPAGMAAGASYELTLPVKSQSSDASITNTATTAPFGSSTTLSASATLTVTNAVTGTFTLDAPNFLAGDGATGTITAPTLSGSIATGFSNAVRKVRFYYTTLVPASPSGTMKMDAWEAATNTAASVGTLATSLPTAVERDVYFNASGVGKFDLNFDNVGQFVLYADWQPSYEASPPSGAPAQLSGNDGYIVSPYRYELTPSITSGSGGSEFNITVTAQALCGKAGWGYTCPGGSSYTTTTNFAGSAATAVTVAVDGTGLNHAPALWCTTVSATCPADQSTAPSVAASAFSAGVATLSGVHWSEVGTLTLQAQANYLGAGNFSGTGGSASFFPARFHGAGSVSSDAGSFAYFGQPAIDLTQTITAQAAAPGGSYATAQNYAATVYGGSLATVRSLSLVGATPTNLCPDSTCTPPITNPAVGVSSCTWTAGACALTAANAQVPRPGSASAPQTLAFTVQVSSTETIPSACAVSAPVVCDGGTSAPLFTYGNIELRYGRVRLTNAFGSAALALQAPVVVEYYSSGGYWATNTVDNTANSATTTAWTVSPSASTALSGTGASGSTTPSLASGVSAGQTTLSASAPGAGSSGYIDLTLTVPDYLQFPWTGGTAANPKARFSFGLYNNSSRTIDRREVR